MSLLTKGIMIVLFFSLMVGLIALLPATSDYPLPPEFATALTTVFGYIFAWSSVFTVLNTLLTCALIGITIELSIWIWTVVKWAIGFISRFVG